MATLDGRVLSVWTIYDHPSDAPDTFIARRAELDAGEIRNTDDTIRSQSLLELRRTFADAGLIRFSRDPGDDPVIVECWL